ncbi:MAG: tagaturonate reductase [Spirochaetaceae bacterium]|jgi:tagaturonate reductase|nr:tagaturonate reductase [Spirochaetaceae bacterium]
MKKITEAVKTVSRPEKVLQFGEGNFLRAFADWQIDILNEKTDFNGNIVIVQPLEQGMGDQINAQKGLYTTVLRGVQNGETVEKFRPVSSVSRCLNPFTQFDEYLRCAENPDLRFVISNTTEAGIAYTAEDRLSDRPPRSFPGKAAAFLFRRFEHFKGDPAKALVFIPCELIDKNGDKLRELVERYAEEWRLGEAFRSWLASCDFCNSLVDRIVPGYPKEEAAALGEKLGYEDRLLAAAEIFHLWVIETKNDYAGELPFRRAGLNVIQTTDMSFYRTRKVRILNGAHTSGVLAAFLGGLDTVDQCVTDPLIVSMMKRAIFGEIIPSMEGGRTELTQYANDVLERFANPYIKHRILSIALNSVSKFKTRVLPSLTGYYRKTGQLPPVLTFSLAALIAFYKGGNPVGREMTGKRNGAAYTIQDDEAVLHRFAALYAEAGDAGESPDPGAVRKIAAAVLAAADWWGEDLRVYPGLEDAVSGYLAAILTDGVRPVIERLTAES